MLIIFNKKKIVHGFYSGYTVEPLYNGQLGATVFVHYSRVSVLEGLRVCMYYTIVTQRFIRYNYRGIHYRGVSIKWGFTIRTSSGLLHNKKLTHLHFCTQKKKKHKKFT